MFAPNTAELRIMQDQIGELRTLLHQVNLRQAADFVMEAMDADKFGKHDSGVVETECLVKIASQKILLHHFYYPFLVRSTIGTLCRSLRLFAPAVYTLTVFTAWSLTNYFDGCYAQKRERLLNTDWMRRTGKRLKRKNLGTLTMTPGKRRAKPVRMYKANQKRIIFGLLAARQTSSLLSPATLAIKCDHLGPHC